MQTLEEQIKILEGKIQQASSDTDQFKSTGDTRKAETLEFYKEYLEDELAQLKKRYEEQKAS